MDFCKQSFQQLNDHKAPGEVTWRYKYHGFAEQVDPNAETWQAQGTEEHIYSDNQEQDTEVQAGN